MERLMNSPLVSILVPICNVENYLRQCLDSLVDQTLRDIEIICINDGSTDSSLSIIREYERRDPRIIVIDKPNSGYGDSMNKGIDAAHGEYIGIVESDDFASENMFESLYKVAKDNNLDLVRSNYYAHTTNQNPAEDTLIENLAVCGTYNATFSPVDNPHAFMCQPAIWTGIYRKSFLYENDIRFLPTPGASFQDTSFYFKTLFSASKAMLLKEGYLHYRVDNTNSSVKNQAKVFCICDEYSEIWRYAQKSSEKFQTMKRWIPRQQFGGYQWNLDRLSPNLQQRFYPLYVEQFTKIRDAELIEQGIFEEPVFTHLNAMLDNPNNYFKQNYGPYEPDRTIIACVNQLSKDDAKVVLMTLLDRLSENDEIFVVSPFSENIVLELKNEQNKMGRLRNDTDLINQHLTGHFNIEACRGKSISIIAIGSIDADMPVLAEAADTGKFQYEDSAFVLSYDIALAAKCHTLVNVVLSSLINSKSEVVNAFPKNWTTMLCANSTVDNSNFTAIIESTKEIADRLMQCNQSYPVKKMLFQQLLGVWTSVRKACSELTWNQDNVLQEEYLSMPNVPALAFPFKAIDQQPEISVISPVYNAHSHLTECLNSIAKQTLSNYEVILINDGSTDNSLDLLEEAATKDRRIRVVSQFNCGAGTARNRGIELAKGKRLIFIDSDDQFATDHVFADLVEAMNRTGAEICGGSLSLIEPSGKIQPNLLFRCSFNTVYAEKDVPLKEIWSDYGWIRFMYDSQLFSDKSIRFPQLLWYEDPVFFLKAISKTNGYHVIPTDVYHYRVGHKNVTWTAPKTRDLLIGMKNNLRAAERLEMGELYATIFSRFNLDYYAAIKENLDDPTVYTLVADIQSNLNHELINKYSTRKTPFNLLLPPYEAIQESIEIQGETTSEESNLNKMPERRKYAIERLATKIAESKLYTGAQRTIDHLHKSR